MEKNLLEISINLIHFSKNPAIIFINRQTYPCRINPEEKNKIKLRNLTHPSPISAQMASSVRIIYISFFFFNRLKDEPIKKIASALKHYEKLKPKEPEPEKDINKNKGMER